MRIHLFILLICMTKLIDNKTNAVCIDDDNNNNYEDFNKLLKLIKQYPNKRLNGKWTLNRKNDLSKFLNSDKIIEIQRLNNKDSMFIAKIIAGMLLGDFKGFETLPNNFMEITRKIFNEIINNIDARINSILFVSPRWKQTYYEDLTALLLYNLGITDILDYKLVYWKQTCNKYFYGVYKFNENGDDIVVYDLNINTVDDYYKFLKNDVILFLSNHKTIIPIDKINNLLPV